MKVFKFNLESNFNRSLYERLNGYLVWNESDNKIKGYSNSCILYGYYNPSTKKLNFIKAPLKLTRILLYTFENTDLEGSMQMYSENYHHFVEFVDIHQSVYIQIEEIVEDADRLTNEILNTFMESTNSASIQILSLLNRTMDIFSDYHV